MEKKWNIIQNINSILLKIFVIIQSSEIYLMLYNLTNFNKKEALQLLDENTLFSSILFNKFILNNFPS